MPQTAVVFAVLTGRKGDTVYAKTEMWYKEDGAYNILCSNSALQLNICIKFLPAGSDLSVVKKKSVVLNTKPTFLSLIIGLF